MKKMLLSILLTVVFGTPVFAQMMEKEMARHMEGHEHMMETGNMDRMGEMMGMCLEHAGELGLTAEQTEKLKPLHREMQKKRVQFRAELKIAEIDLQGIMEVKDFNLEQASAAVRKIADIKSGYYQDMLKSMKEVRTVLTDEQFKKMKSMMPMMKEGKKMEKKVRKHKGHK